MRDIVLRYQMTDDRLADLYYRFCGAGPYEDRPFVPTEEKLAAIEAERKELAEAVEALPEPTPSSSIWKSHYRDFAAGMAMDLSHARRNPTGSLQAAAYAIIKTFRLDGRSDEVRICHLETMIHALPGVLSAIEGRASSFDEETRGALSTYAKHLAEQTEETIERIPMWFENRTGEQDKRLRNCLTEYRQLLSDFADLSAWEGEAIAAAPEDDEKTCNFEEAEYRAILSENLGVDLTELLSWYEEEVAKTREEVFAIARRLPIPENDPKSMQEVNAILTKYAGPYDSEETLFARGREYLDRAQAAAREVIELPADETCRLAKVPRALKFSYPWGGYEGTDPHTRPIVGQFFLNEENFAAVTDGWVKMMAIHEAYPGHHCQYVRGMIDPIPETAKIGAKDIPLLEGSAHRSERMFEYVFAEDPFYPLFVAYRRHHTATRVKADLMLRYFGNPIKDVVKLYMDELGFDRKTARGQVKAQENMEGYFTCYYYGMKKLEDDQKRYGIDPKTFTEVLFSVGRISIRNFERFLELSEEEKQSFLHDYAALSGKEKP